MINERAVRRFCKEDISKIKNYDLAIADTTQTWDCHHMTETWWNCSKKELIENECYYNRKACELIFLTHAEHISLHHKGKKRKPFTEETRRKMSEAHKGQLSWNIGKHHSDETRRKMSEAKKNITDETRRKMSEAAKRREARKRKLHSLNGGTVNGSSI